MGFTTQTFLFVFFPVCVAAYYLIHLVSTRGPAAKLFSKAKLPDIVLIAMSLFFYNWAGVGEAWKLAVYIAAVYCMGLVIQLRRNRAECRTGQKTESRKNTDWAGVCIFAVCITAVTFVLVYFKYWDFFKDMFSFGHSGSKVSVAAPIGISFITFSAVSYLADIRRGDADCKSLIDCALYLCFFPKVISGPIVLWKDFCPQCGAKKLTLDKAFEGVERIMTGFAKKLIIADTFGACIAKTAAAAIDVPTAWGVNLLFMFQLYFDFSGYSDIAVGLGKLLGYEMKENFNFPYLSTSITDFWRRWHISLGTWFKEYIYIPLGGSRKGKARTVINLAAVFLLTGLWHGASWTFVLWGLINGLFRILEKLAENSGLYKAIPSVVKWLVTTVIVYFCWIVFRFTDFKELSDWFGLMFGEAPDRVPYTLGHYFDRQIISLVVIAFFCSTVPGTVRFTKACEAKRTSAAAVLVKELAVIVLFVISIMFMVNSTYSPFLYFQY